MPKEQTLEDWVSDMTIAHNNHAKAIEVLDLRERGLNEKENKSRRACPLSNTGLVCTDRSSITQWIGLK